MTTHIPTLTLQNVTVEIKDGTAYFSCPVPGGLKGWPQDGDQFYQITNDGDRFWAAGYTYRSTGYQKGCLKRGSIFSTTEECELSDREEILRAHLRRECERLGGRYKGWNQQSHVTADFLTTQKIIRAKADTACSEFNFLKHHECEQFIAANEKELREYYRITQEATA